MFNNQSQKGGANSVNQQAKDGGVNQNADRDINNSYTIQTAKEKQDFGIISEIFDFIFKNKISNIDLKVVQDSKKITKLKEKVFLNFNESDKKEISDILTKNWGRIEIVEKYVQEKNEISPENIDALILKIKSLYREKKSCSSSEERVKNIHAFDGIAKEFITPEKLINSDYYANSLAIVLYFFQMCEIGKKTTAEEQSVINLFK